MSIRELASSAILEEFSKQLERQQVAARVRIT